MLTAAQITAIIALLIAFNVDQPTIANVEAILAPTQQTTQQTVPSTPSSELAGSSVVMEPTLSFTGERTGNRVSLKAVYTTDVIDETTPWTFKTQDWNKTGICKDYDFGTFKTPGCFEHVWSLQDDHTMVFEGNDIYNATTTFTLDVGGISQQITL